MEELKKVNELLKKYPAFYSHNSEIKHVIDVTNCNEDQFAEIEEACEATGLQVENEDNKIILHVQKNKNVSNGEALPVKVKAKAPAKKAKAKKRGK